VDVANSIKRIKLVYNERFVACMEVTYEFLGLSIERMYSNNLNEKFSNVETVIAHECVSLLFRLQIVLNSNALFYSKSMYVTLQLGDKKSCFSLHMYLWN
jgi:hypothetical protein